MRKPILTSLLCIFMLSTAYQPLVGDELDKLAEDTDKLWRRGAGAEDGAFTAVAATMLGWGVGLAVVFALMSILIESSDSDSAHSHSHSHCN